MMKNAVIRNYDGRVEGSINYFWNNEDECWSDRKVKPENIMFPQHTGVMHSEVKCYHISELNMK